MSIKRFVQSLKFNEVGLQKNEQDNIINAEDLGSRDNKFFFNLYRKGFVQIVIILKHISQSICASSALCPHQTA